MINDSVRRERRAIVRGQEWSVAQFMQGIAGLVLLVLGGVVFAKAGFQFDPPGRANILFEQTTWFALIEVLLGLLLLGGATNARDRSLGIFASLACTALGLILALAPDAASGRLVGGDSGPGVLLAIIGILTAIATIIAPSRRAAARDAVIERDAMVTADPGVVAAPAVQQVQQPVQQVQAPPVQQVPVERDPLV